MHKLKSLKINVLLNTIRSILGVVFPLITIPYVTRILDVENIGRYYFSASIISYFVYIAGLGIGRYAVREGARVREDKKKFKQFADEIFSFSLVSTAISYLLLFILIVFTPRLNEYYYILLILSLQIFFNAFGIEWIFSIYEDYLYITIRTILLKIISLVLLFLFVRNADDILIYTFISIITGVGSNFVNFFYAKKHCKVKWTRNINWKIHTKPIMLLFIMAIGVIINSNFDKTIVGLISGDYSVGIYAIAKNVFMVITILFSSIIVVSLPRISFLIEKKDATGFIILANKIYNSLLTLVIPAVVGIIVLRKEVILIIAGDTYLQATSSLGLLSIALLFNFGGYFWAECVLVPLNQEKGVVKAVIICAFSNIMLNFILVPKWHERAAAFACIITMFMYFCYCHYEGRKHVNIKNTGLLVAKICIGCVAIIFCSLIFNNIREHVVMYTICTLCSSILTYFTVQIFLKNDVVLEILDKVLVKFKLNKRK